MEYLLEWIVELFFEGGIELSKSQKVPKGIRYLLIATITFFFLVVIGLILFIGIAILAKKQWQGLIFIILGIFLLVGSVIKWKKIYGKKKRRTQKSKK